VPDLIIAGIFILAVGMAAGAAIERAAARRREKRRMRRLSNGVRIRAPRAPQAVRREVAHG
jgi:hypothetical protein